MRMDNRVGRHEVPEKPRLAWRWGRWVWALLAVGCWVLALRSIRETWFYRRTDVTWELIRQGGVIRVCMDATYPPFGLQDSSGRFSGYDVALVEELARRWGVRAEFVNVHFDGLYDALLAGKCEVLASALPYDETLTEDVLYSPSYFNAGLLLVVNEGARGISGVNDLAGKRVSVETGSSAHLEAVRLLEQAKIPLQIVDLATTQDALQALREGQVDAAIADSVSVYAFARDPGGICYLQRFLADEQYVFALRPGSQYVRRRIADELARMQKDGFLQGLQSQWF
jgi:ABC-type amino acid transport substrate-binding protein